jgi:multiple sugar transport system substrate-binding protein
MKVARKRWIRKEAALLVLPLLLAACGGTGTKDGGTGQSGAEKPPAPVTLNFFYNGYSTTLIDELKQKVAQKYPHITLNMLLDLPGNAIENVLGSGTKLDLVAFSAGGLFKVMDLQLGSDLTELVKKHGFDLNRLAPGVLDAAMSYSGNKGLTVMPYELNNSVLLYNKTIFDKFGVSYPKDGMTWNDVLELVKKTTRQESGVQYQGFAYIGANPVYKDQLALPFVDPATNKATINSDGWKRYLEVMGSFYKVQGNELKGQPDDFFFKEQTMAMRTGPSPLELLPDAIAKGLNWDAVSFPLFPGAEQTGSQMNAPFYAIPPDSPNKDEAFKVIAYLLSDEVQEANARKGRVPTIKSDKALKEFGSELALLKGTHYAEAVMKEKIAKPIAVTKYDGVVRSQVSGMFSKVIQNQADVNTAMRTAEEAANKQIAEMQSK